MKKKGRKGQRSLAERLLLPFGTSVAGRCGYRVEVEGTSRGRCLLVSGARRILEAGEECVVLVLSDETLSILGKGLLCLTYDGGIAEIAGEVEEILFAKGVGT